MGTRNGQEPAIAPQDAHRPLTWLRAACHRFGTRMLAPILAPSETRADRPVRPGSVASVAAPGCMAPAVAPAPRPPLPPVVWTLPVLAVLAVVGLYAWPGSGRAEATPPSFLLRAEIQEQGPALFYAVRADRRYRIWTVHCRMPMRSCEARAPGLVLRLDAQRQAWLLAATAPDARLSVAQGATTRDLPRLLGRPLDEDTVGRLSRPGSRLLIEEQGRVAAAIATEGLNEVLAYLFWLDSDTARTLRDARLWPRSGALDPTRLTEPMLERYAAQQRYTEGAKAQHVPRTKPQIEFAIRAQDGPSFFGSDGNWVR